MKTQIDFYKAFAEAFQNIVVKRQTCNNQELTENKEVCNNEELTENKEVCNNEKLTENKEVCNNEELTENKEVCNNEELTENKEVCNNEELTENKEVCNNEELTENKEVCNNEELTENKEVCNNEELTENKEVCNNEELTENKEVCNNEELTENKEVCNNEELTENKEVCNNEELTENKEVCNNEELTENKEVCNNEELTENKEVCNNEELTENKEVCNNEELTENKEVCNNEELTENKEVCNNEELTENKEVCNNEELTENKEVCNNEELTENKEVAYIELLESNETSFCDSHFEVIDTDDQVATQPSFKSLIPSESSNSQISFDAVFLDNFPDIAANYQSRDTEFSERECPVNTSQLNEELKRNVTAQHQLSSDSLEVCSDNDVACHQAIRSSELLWNASDLVFGSFHQNDGRFSEQSRGYQCTCNALCMLSYAHCGDVDNTCSMVLDKVLYVGDALYQAVIRKLKSDGKFSQHLLSLEEIPDDFEVEIRKFTLEKFHIESGPLIDTHDLGLPTLHEVLQSAFLSASSGLLTVGAICSAVFKKKGAYAFFDSHCHGHNGLSATDGASCLITFSSLDDLVRYMYAFYDSMKLDTSMQYDFLPINVRKSQNKQSYKDKMASHMEAYFNDQRLRQANKSQSEVRSISNDLSSIAIEKSKKKLYGLKERNLKIAVSISNYTKENVDKTQLSEEKKEIQSNLQEVTLLLGPKKVCIEKNQSNLPDKILFLGPKKVCIRKNQSNLQEKIQSLRWVNSLAKILVVVTFERHLTYLRKMKQA